MSKKTDDEQDEDAHRKGSESIIVAKSPGANTFRQAYDGNNARNNRTSQAERWMNREGQLSSASYQGGIYLKPLSVSTVIGETAAIGNAEEFRGVSESHRVL